MALTSPAYDLEADHTVLLERLEHIYREHHRFVWRCVRRMGISRERMEDVVQDVFVVVSRRLPEFRGESSIRTWLFSIVFRVVCEHRRRNRRELARPRVWLATAPGTVHDDVERREAARLLEHLLDRLDADQRAVFVLAELEDMPASEIARATGVTINTVYSRLRLARKKLERELGRIRAREHRRTL